ncbi:hypothetical protein [Bhargavaea massiliensis]|uniref:hypothetical protein n=1 Tax=Bhargavaea massiliensis TaxID=2697500 RepID=UPI001BCC53B5|nr:hypothetical protein [Bhargavaea massiliensis]
MIRRFMTDTGIFIFRGSQLLHVISNDFFQAVQPFLDLRDIRKGFLLFDDVDQLVTIVQLIVSTSDRFLYILRYLLIEAEGA